MKKNFLILFLILSIMSLFGCNTKENIASKTDSPNESADSITQEKSALTIAAAASLTEAFIEIGAAFEASKNCRVTFSFASTATLSEQITNGAPFDVFAAANESAITGLDEKGLILSDTRQIYAIGRIGIASYKGRGVEATTMDGLKDPNIKIIAIASPEHAPYGLAAKQAIETAELWDILEPKIVFGKNIAETLSYLMTGNADVAIIALSQKDELTLNYSIIDSDMHAPLTQAMAVLSDTDNEELAKSFVAFVNGPKGKEIMHQYGFVTPEE
ncbi:molybdate ABC transporter substrate-binding protein [Petrocella sp. FN5]|uniref:molybdate ABC transporter substrate-binding protein n=1 Tax=Petrocella sp. FN5 TaxID=3032002 RepID=UPI0023DA730F|nr:molybdate ABC transporter substrate-binding protein [Petrocella sp. FN5]MDF1617511.1 molybdate ABC transporter substrate-binding protein [Petrocella sp. FN5]